MSRGINLVFSLLYCLLLTISSGFSSQEALEITSESDISNLEDLPGNVSPSVPKRKEKLFSIFSVVRFSNDMCGSGTYNGTCLTAVECFAAGGSFNSTCAAGFGVCCVFLYQTCGGSTNRNCTYFQSPGYPSSSVSTSLQCSFTVNKCSTDICQVRLDFLAFGLAQPEAQSATNYPQATQCTTDSFTVTGASNNVPAICGLNTGQHVYLDMTAGQNSFSLNFAIGSGTGPPGQTVVTANQRYWNVKISQIPCDSPSLAPSACLQYFSSASGTIRTFNYDLATPANSRHLANQDYPICIRMEQGFCGICYSTCDDSRFAFGLSNGYSTTWTTNTNAAIPYFCLNDYVQIAGAFLPAVGTFPAEFSDRICGGAFGIRTGTNAVSSPMTVCTETKPFQVRVVTDSNEVVSSGTIPLESGVYGFCLNYAQQACVTSG